MNRFMGALGRFTGLITVMAQRNISAGRDRALFEPIYCRYYGGWSIRALRCRWRRLEGSEVSVRLRPDLESLAEI